MFIILSLYPLFLPCPLSPPLSGGGASGLLGVCPEGVGPSSSLVVKTSGDIVIDMSTSSAPGWKAILTNST